MSSYDLSSELISYWDENKMAHPLGKADWTDRDRIKYIVETYSRRYDMLFWKNLVELVGTQKRDVIVDFGCGPGLFLVDASNKFAATRLIGLDESREMLDQAKIFIDERTSAVSYELTVTDFNEVEIPIPHSSVDLAFCGFMLHEMASPQNLVEQASRTLRSGGKYIVYDWISGNEEMFVRKMTEQGMSHEQARLRYPHMCKHSLDDIIGLMEAASLKDVKGIAVNDIRGLVVGLMK
ncbi:MAG: class I SAM-dependent methyltransferase [Candidatus Thorarchaeota archaeon]|nr:class I SAM-dependent methyltransferase [Candidatus Thorarchaeota archaeon]